jgi:Ni/Fe-hydrogenase subunit HybB-like protein
MEEKRFSAWTDMHQFILLPYIGIRWDYDVEICMMWACFCMSFKILRKR